VGVVTLKAQALDVTRELSGRTVAAETAEIRTQISGIVQARLFDEGSVVKVGQALYQIDPASYQAAQDSADAAAAKAETTLQSARLTAVRQASLLVADAGPARRTGRGRGLCWHGQRGVRGTGALESWRVALHRIPLRGGRTCPDVGALPQGVADKPPPLPAPLAALINRIDPLPVHDFWIKAIQEGDGVKPGAESFLGQHTAEVKQHGANGQDRIRHH
jgi:pyruvate/2-oxoglutarate dehydrogenase complex dihydrolipoamide acyltransferase (E2) component